MMSNDLSEDLVEALYAFLALGETNVLDQKVDKEKHDKAMDKLNDICDRNKITIDQLSQTVMNVVKETK